LLFLSEEESRFEPLFNPEDLDSEAALFTTDESSAALFTTEESSGAEDQVVPMSSRKRKVEVVDLTGPEFNEAPIAPRSLHGITIDLTLESEAEAEEEEEEGKEEGKEAEVALPRRKRPLNAIYAAPLLSAYWDSDSDA
jgi:hypothetical protein